MHKNKEKISNYIIDTTNPVGLYSYNPDNSKMDNYKEISGEDMKDFFRNNFFVTHEDFNDHNIVMRNIINSFVTNPVNSIQIMEYVSEKHLTFVEDSTNADENYTRNFIRNNIKLKIKRRFKTSPI